MAEERFFKAFLGLQIAGLAGTTIVLLTTLLSPIVARRHPIYLNFNITWLISCVSYILLIGKPVDEKPSHPLCFVQAVLIYTVPILTAVSTTVLVVHVKIAIKKTLSSTSDLHWNTTTLTVLLVLLPYLPAVCMAVLAIIIGFKYPDTIDRDSEVFYCTINQGIPGKVSGVAVAATMLACAVLEFLICLDLRRNWVVLRADPRSTSMTIRVALFTLVGICAIVMGVLFFFTSAHTNALNVLLAIVPVAAVLVFGTQRDIVGSWKTGLLWICGRKPEKNYSHSQPLSISTFRSTYRSRSDSDGLRPGYPPEFWSMKDDSSTGIGTAL